MKIPAIKFQQQDNSLYIFKIKASKLYEIVAINQREDDKDTGYQRTLSISRAKAISKYITQKQRPIAPGLVVVFENSSFDENESTITIPDQTNAGWVIDGQHRLRGAKLAADEGIDIELAVIAFLNLSESDQVEQFITINQEAKSVPASLYLDLKRQIPTLNAKTATEVAKEKTVDIADVLRKNPKSIFFEKIAVTSSPSKGQISLNNFVRKVHPHLVEGKGAFATYTSQEVAIILDNYYKGLSKYEPDFFKSAEKNIFFKTLGFGALINALPTFFQWVAKEYNSTFTIETVEQGFLKIDHTDFNFTSWEKAGTGSDAEKRAGTDLINAIEDGFTHGGSESKIKLF
ncbi:DGQHR domain-containing protein [Acinetobacter sp. SwsAc6]|uniref:DGQHR domain-containing protein n=1 Tax=unclassified Acinetobacter TaxID=196816 RepID=UPI000DD0AD51|nr:MULTISPECIES: DGQHR domain-containing protein [unclassified Acinetobacter]NWK73755.1 DGQHR domain-containing protein [Acinetobacter sp. SwsAc6]